MRMPILCKASETLFRFASVNRPNACKSKIFLLSHAETWHSRTSEGASRSESEKVTRNQLQSWDTAGVVCRVYAVRSTVAARDAIEGGCSKKWDNCFKRRQCHRREINQKFKANPFPSLVRRPYSNQSIGLISVSSSWTIEASSCSATAIQT